MWLFHLLGFLTYPRIAFGRCLNPHAGEAGVGAGAHVESFGNEADQKLNHWWSQYILG